MSTPRRTLKGKIVLIYFPFTNLSRRNLDWLSFSMEKKRVYATLCLTIKRTSSTLSEEI